MPEVRFSRLERPSDGADSIGRLSPSPPGTDDLSRLALCLLRVVAGTLDGARSVALLRPRRTRLALVASSRVDDVALATAQSLWRERKAVLERGQVLYVPDHFVGSHEIAMNAPRRLSALLLPALNVRTKELLGCLYADVGIADAWCATDLTAVLRFQPLLTRLLQRRGFSETRRDKEAELRADESRQKREELLAAFAEHGWNVARVARQLGVSRMTVFNRCAKLKITKEAIQREELARAVRLYQGDVAKVSAALRLTRRAVLRRMQSLKAFELPRTRHGRPKTSPDVVEETLRALTQHDWSVRTAARVLHVEPQTVWKRIRRHGLKRPPQEPTRKQLLKALGENGWDLRAVERAAGISRATLRRRLGPVVGLRLSLQAQKATS